MWGSPTGSWGSRVQIRLQSANHGIKRERRVGKTGRNDPCPCGSGKKYKKCCLEKEQPGANRQSQHSIAPGIAIDWLFDKHPDLVQEAIDGGFMRSIDLEEFEGVSGLSPGQSQVLQIHISEWLITSARLNMGRRKIPAMELVFGKGGPLMTAGQRAYLEEMAGRWLSIYEVEESIPGQGLRLRDLLRPKDPLSWVVERAGSQSLERWDVIGARVITVGEEHQLSGAIYSLNRERAFIMAEYLRGEINARRSKSSQQALRETIELAIIDDWISRLMIPFKPLIMDVSTGEPMVLVTDHYRVGDWTRLEQALRDQEDVDGDREEGWTRFEELESSELRRSLAMIDPLGGDRIKVLCRSLKRADMTRRWLESIAVDAFEHITREIVDPISDEYRPQVETGAADRAGSGKTGGIPGEELNKLHLDMLIHHYKGWADEPIPFLDHMTPSEAVRTSEGREKVLFLIRSYQLDENKGAKQMGRNPVSFTFLLPELGIPEDEL